MTIEKGIEQGIERGQRLLLQRLIRTRFGAVPAEVVDRIEKASAAELESWADRVLTARSLDAVFSGE